MSFTAGLLGNDVFAQVTRALGRNNKKNKARADELLKWEEGQSDEVEADDEEEEDTDEFEGGYATREANRCDRILLGFSRILLCATNIFQIVDLFNENYFQAAVTSSLTPAKINSIEPVPFVANTGLGVRLDTSVWVVNMVQYVPVVTVIALVDILLELFRSSMDLRMFLRASLLTLLASIYLCSVLPITLAHAEGERDPTIAVITVHVVLVVCFIAACFAPLRRKEERLTQVELRFVDLVALSLLVFIQAFVVVKDIVYLVITFPGSTGGLRNAGTRVAVLDHVFSSSLTVADLFVSVCTLVLVYYECAVNLKISKVRFMLGVLQYITYAVVALILPVGAPLFLLLLFFLHYALYVPYTDVSTCTTACVSCHGFTKFIEASDVSLYYFSTIARGFDSNEVSLRYLEIIAGV